MIVPTRDRPDRLRDCLRSIAGIDYPRDRFEIIVVNDGGASLDRAIGGMRTDVRIQTLKVRNRGPAIARNAGVEAATGEYVAFTDDDCMVSTGWLSAYAAGFERHPDAMLGGPIVNGLPDNLFAATSQLLIDYLYRYYNHTPGRGKFLTSNNMAVSREALRAAGGFDPLFVRAAGEDRDLCARWSHAGRPIWLIEGARVDHFHEMGWAGFVRQHFNYGRGANYFRILEARRGIGKVRMEPITFYRNMLYAPWQVSGPLLASATSTLLASSQVANALGYLWERLVATTMARS